MNKKKLDLDINSQKYFEKKNTSALVSRVPEHCNTPWEPARECQHSGCRGRGALASQNSKTLPINLKNSEKSRN
jgi:hypothetical protein